MRFAPEWQKALTRVSTKVVNLLLDRWPQRLLLADDTDAKVRVGLGRKLLMNRGQSHNQIQWAGARRTETLNGIPAFLYSLLHELKNRIEPGFDLRIGRQALDGRSKLAQGT
jgi:hypothetical protein